MFLTWASIGTLLSALSAGSGPDESRQLNLEELTALKGTLLFLGVQV